MRDCVLCDNACGHGLCVHKVPIFSALAKADLLKLLPMIAHSEHPKGSLLFREGETPEALFILNKGSVKAYKYTPEGREQILYIFSEGDFFGEQYLFGSRAAAYFVEALEPLKLCRLTKNDFQQMLLAHPEIAVKIIEQLEARMSRLENAMQSMGVRSVDTRLSALLHDFMLKYGAPTPQGILIRLPLSREGIANALGVARETVSRKLTLLEKEGVIRPVGGRSLLVTDSDALKELAGIDDCGDAD